MNGECEKEEKREGFFDKFIGAKLERVHTIGGLKSVTLSFDNNECFTLECELKFDRYGIIPVLKGSRGHWCLVEADDKNILKFTQSSVDENLIKLHAQASSECGCIDCNPPNLDEA